MTIKYVGDITFNGDVPAMPTDTNIPEKKEWSKYAIWVFNGKQYNPVSQKAVDSLDNAVKTLAAKGYVGAKKEGKRKLSSIKYYIKTLGVEDFTLTK